MSRLFILILFVASCQSQEVFPVFSKKSPQNREKSNFKNGLDVCINILDKDNCQDVDTLPSPESGCCGIQLANDDFEISGEAANNQFPWLALVQNQSGEKSYTGTLISSRHVLTSSFFNIFDRITGIIVHLGLYNRNRPDCVMAKGKRACINGTVTIPAAAIRGRDVNTTYGFIVHDFAIIKLAQKAPYNEFIRPICLPTSDILVSPPDNLRFIKAVWDIRPSRYYEYDIAKHYVTLPYINQKKCQEIYRSFPLSENFIINNEMCAGGERTSGGCNEDGGGLLMLKENGHYTLIGMVEYFNFFCGTEVVPEIFERVFPYSLWINSVIAELG